MSQSAWLSSMNTLKKHHDRIADLLQDKKIAFIDIPVYFNVGDLLIYKGTEAFIEKHKLNVIYRSCVKTTNFKQLQKADIILFQGGGNFGDLYPNHQQLREKVVAHFKHKRLVCLPQTIHFNSTTLSDESAAIFRQHNDYHFFVRDNNSFNTDKSFTDNVYMMPDMAHSLHPLVDTTEVGISNLAHLGY
jgi:pyruvyl transferase EpsO